MKLDYGSKEEGNLIKLNYHQKRGYIEICTKIWGGVPVDVNWAMGTNMYKSNRVREDWVEVYLEQIS